MPSGLVVPIRECALNLQCEQAKRMEPTVAFHAGAWIETALSPGGSLARPVAPCGGVDRNEAIVNDDLRLLEVAPVRGRRSKLGWDDQKAITRPSPLVRGRGLKRRRLGRQHVRPAVAPRVGAWIETEAAAAR